MQHPLHTPASIRRIVKSIPPEVILLLPVMLVTHTIILRLEGLRLPRESTAIILRRQFAGAI